MRSFRATLAVISALLFVFATNRCVIAAAFSGGVVECCDRGGAPGDAERGLPCGGKDCAPCATLESGVNFASLVPLAVPAPVWTEACEFAELMRRLALAATADSDPPPPEPETIPSPPWRDGMVKAVPVRGPSFVI